MKRTGVDWTNVRERLAASERALEETLAHNPKRVEEAYRERAIRLAAIDLDHKPAAAGVSVLVFELDQERYAIEVNDLAEVLPFERCVPVPGSPRQFLGVINLRGKLRAVLNLRDLLGLSGGGNGETGFVAMLRRPGKEIGLKVDRIEELREIRREELTPPKQGSYGQGLISGRVMLLSVDAVLEAAFSKKESRTA